MIFELLHVGYENRVSREQLMRETGLSLRDLRQQVRDERLNGALILSTKGPGGGYWLPGSLEEMKAYERWARREADSHDDILKPLQAEIKKLEEKEKISEAEKSDTEK